MVHRSWPKNRFPRKGLNKKLFFYSHLLHLSRCFRDQISFTWHFMFSFCVMLFTCSSKFHFYGQQPFPVDILICPFIHPRLKPIIPRKCAVAFSHLFPHPHFAPFPHLPTLHNKTFLLTQLFFYWTAQIQIVKGALIYRTWIASCTRESPIIRCNNEEVEKYKFSAWETFDSAQYKSGYWF